MNFQGRIVDAWMQHPTRNFVERPMFDSLKRWSHGTFAFGWNDPPIAHTIRAMDEAGVRLGLCCAWWGPQGPLVSNDQVAAFVRAHPERLVGVGSVDLHRPMAAVRELRRCIRERGFRALRIVPWLWGLPPDDRRYYPSTRNARARNPVLPPPQETLRPLCRIMLRDSGPKAAQNQGCCTVAGLLWREGAGFRSHHSRAKDHWAVRFRATYLTPTSSTSTNRNRVR